MKTKLNLLAVGIFLATVTAGYGPPLITNQPQTQASAPGMTSFTDTNAAGTKPFFYRVGWLNSSPKYNQNSKSEKVKR